MGNPQKLTCLLLGLVIVSSPVAAGTLYYTNFGGRQIYSLDTVTKATTLIDSVPGTNGNPDSLIFDSSGRIIYTIYNGSPGQIRVFDPVAHTDTLLTATTFGSQLTDLTLEPGGGTLLVADRGANTIDRVNISTGVTTTLGAAGAFSGPNGLTYDNSGNLFAAVGSSIEKINPTTGAVIASGGFFVDGLTYDSVSGKLWGATGSCIYSFDTTTLAGSACINTSVIGSGNDGIVSDGAGHLFFAASGSAIVGQYTIAGGTLVAVSNNLGSLDDIAPASGLGAPPPPGVPEPMTAMMVGIGVAAAGIIRRRRSRSI